jgi:RNA polymerase sigma-70 factor (ECF subfamily)
MSNMAKLIAKQTESNLTEAEAIRQAKDGVAAAFEYLYKAHCRRVYSLCLRMIKNPAEAEDLTQQAFLQLFRKISTFRGESDFSTWLHRVTVNIVLMHLRRKKPTEILAEAFERCTSNGESSSEHGSSDTSMFGAIERLNLMRAIRKLPSGYKQVSCCMTSLDTNTARSRDSWVARLGVQNRSFTRPANDSGVYCKENKDERKPVSPPRRAEIRPAPK